MRVLHVAGNLDADSGGSTSAAFHTCGYLREHGVDAVLAGTWQGPGAADYIAADWPGLPVRGFMRRPPRHYWRSPALRRWLASEVRTFDLVVAHGVFKFPFVDAARAARRSGVRYLVQPHGSLDPYDLRIRGQATFKTVFGRLVVRGMLSRAASVVVTSEREREELVTFGAACSVDVVPLPVAGPSRAPDGDAFRRRFGIDSGAPVILFLSRVDPKKGVERLLAALVELRVARPDVQLVVCGAANEPQYENALREEAGRRGVADAVTWAGLVVGEEKWDAYAGADVFALPSENENFGIVVLEALLAGTPAVISDQVYIADELARSGAATYVCGTDVRSLVTQLEKALSDDRLPATDAVERTFSPSAVTRSTIAVYEKALARSQPGA